MSAHNIIIKIVGTLIAVVMIPYLIAFGLVDIASTWSYCLWNFWKEPL